MLLLHQTFHKLDYLILGPSFNYGKGSERWSPESVTLLVWVRWKTLGPTAQPSASSNVHAYR